MRQARVHRVTRGGTVYKYHRVTRAPLPHDVPEDAPRFIEAWLAEDAKGAPRLPGHGPGTIGGDVDDFLDDPAAIRDVGPAYRAMLRRHLLAIAKAYGAARTADLEERHVRKDVEALEGAVAQHRLKTWRFFLKWARKAQRVAGDPSKGVERPRLPPSDGHVPWSAEDVATFRARWPIGTAPRAAMELLHWSAARVSDGVKLAHGMARDGLLTYRQTKTERRSKTKGEAHVPWTGPLKPFAQGMAADRDMMHEALRAFAPKSLLVLPTERGARRTAKGLSNTINDAAREAGLVDRTAHGLRKTRLIALAEAGATTHQIAAWGGHASLKEIEHYTELADRRAALLGGPDVKQDDPPVKPARKP